MNKKLYVAYGSNLNISQMKHRCPTAKLFGTGTAEGYELQFKGRPHGAFATIASKEGGSVPVAVWEIQPRDERSLDLYEGYPSHYFKEDVVVIIDGNEIEAMVYIMNQRMEFGIPTQGYYNTVHEGYEDCGLDTAALEQALENSTQQYCNQMKQVGEQISFEFNPYDEDFEEDLNEEFEEDEDLDFWNNPSF